MTTFSNELIDQLLTDYKNPEDLLGDKGILKILTKRLVERALNGEITHHLGYCVFRRSRPPNSVKAATLDNDRRRIRCFILGGRFDQVNIRFPPK